MSPGKAAADAAPPTAGPITVPVESRVIANELVIRGDVGYDDPVTLRVETGDLGGPAVVTGQVPVVGAEIGPASVALEIVGRPVIVLPGDLPTYRSLRAGVSGPDVRPAQGGARRSLGIDAGNPDGDAYDAATAAGVRALYQRVGYEPPSAGEELQDAVAAARDGVRAAQDALSAAQRELSAAAVGPVAVGDHRSGHRGHGRPGDARPGAGAVRRPDRGGALQPDRCGRGPGCARAGEGGAGRGGRLPRTPAPSAPRCRRRSRSWQRPSEDQAEAQAATLTPLPASEVVFVPSLPRRVDVVQATRGGTITGEFMSVSGATIQITGSATRADAELLAVGTVGSITLDDQEMSVTVAAVKDPSTAPATTEGERRSRRRRTSRRSRRVTAGRWSSRSALSRRSRSPRSRTPTSASGSR